MPELIAQMFLTQGRQSSKQRPRAMDGPDPYQQLLYDRQYDRNKRAAQGTMPAIKPAPTYRSMPNVEDPRSQARRHPSYLHKMSEKGDRWEGKTIESKMGPVHFQHLIRQAEHLYPDNPQEQRRFMLEVVNSMNQGRMDRERPGGMLFPEIPHANQLGRYETFRRQLRHNQRFPKTF